jgi:ADP-dependent NAD(P)H-hydrate dehydratase
MNGESQARTTPRAATLITHSTLRNWPLPVPSERLGKEDRGRVFVVGGSEEIPGAVILAAIGALRAGAGKLLVATSQSVAASVAIAMPEARVIGLRQSESGELARQSCERIHADAARVDALVVGPGMIDPVAGVELISACLAWQRRPTLIIDAAPLVAVQKLRDALKLAYQNGAQVILTPHAGEMARLCGVSREEVLERPLAMAREVAAQLGAVVALKGARTYIAAPDGTAFENTAGNSGLGTSGSGDALAGIMAGLCARGAEPLQAAVWGVYLHACAGDTLARKLGPLGYLAREILAEIPALLASLGPRQPRAGC